MKTKDEELFEEHPKHTVSRDDTCIKQLNISNTSLHEEGHHNDASINILGGIAFLSTVRVMGVQTNKNTFIIRATGEATVYICKCDFSQNIFYALQSGIFYIEKSTVAFHDSVFSENKGLLDVVIFAVDSIVNISRCIFKENAADTGGVINARNVADFNIINSEFISNTAFQKGIFIVNSYKRLSIYNSTFLHNTAKFGSVLSFRVLFALEDNLAHSLSLGDQTMCTSSGPILVIKCTFEDNKSLSASLFDVESELKMKITDSIFRRNHVYMGSAVQIASGANVTIENTMFLSNSGNQLLRAYLNATLSLSNCTVSNHSRGSSVILISSRTRLTMVRCTFVNNSWLIHGGGIVSAEMYSSVTANSCAFYANHAWEGGVFYVYWFSELNVKSSIFVNNSAMNGHGGVARIENSAASFESVQVINCSSPWGFGGVIASLNSQTKVKYSTFKANWAISGGAIYLSFGSGLATFNCLFDENGADDKGNTLFKVGTGNVSLENCILRNSNAITGGSMLFKDSNYLRLSKGLCQYEKAERATCIESGWSTLLFTLNYTISNGLDTINSAHDENFFDNGIKYGIIKADRRNSWTETPFASRM